MQNFSKQYLNQKGTISTMNLVAIAVAVLLVIAITCYFAIGNKGANQEAAIEGHYRANQSILSACTVSIRGASQISKSYTKELESIIKAEMEGRYGGPGTNRVAMFVQERAQNYDPKMKEKVQNEIISCETRFDLHQRKMVELQTDYEKMLNSAFTGAILNARGYPKKDLTKFKLILDGGVQEQFETGTRQDYKLD